MVSGQFLEWDKKATDGIRAKISIEFLISFFRCPAYDALPAFFFSCVFVHDVF